ncbi:MAG: response regulator [Bacteroidia bacterium]|nr:response regulator [Bacteroidia bacterium]
MKRKEPKYKYTNVMLIDDNELDNFINEKTIEANNFSKRIYSNTSAKSALEFLKNLVTMGAHHNDIYPEVIFIDINMPMMDGFQFIEAFKSETEEKMNKPKMVILTSSVYFEDRQKTKEIDKDIVFLNKPLTQEALESI